MQRLYFYVGLILIVMLPILIGHGLYQDLQHPELWDADWNHDPRVYGPFGVLVLGPALFLLARNLLRWRKKKRLWGRLKNILAEATRKQEQGRQQEADSLFEEFETLFAKAFGGRPASFLK